MLASFSLNFLLGEVTYADFVFSLNNDTYAAILKRLLAFEFNSKLTGEIC
jgi:hypothetical protein